MNLNRRLILISGCEAWQLLLTVQKHLTPSASIAFDTCCVEIAHQLKNCDEPLSELFKGTLCLKKAQLACSCCEASRVREDERPPSVHLALHRCSRAWGKPEDPPNGGPSSTPGGKMTVWQLTASLYGIMQGTAKRRYLGWMSSQFQVESNDEY